MGGKAGIVTGAARGIGRAIAEGLSGAGQRSCSVDRDGQVELTAQDLGAEAHVADLAGDGEPEAVFERAAGLTDNWISSSTRLGFRPADRRWTWTTKVGSGFTW